MRCPYYCVMTVTIEEAADDEELRVEVDIEVFLTFFDEAGDLLPAEEVRKSIESQVRDDFEPTQPRDEADVFVNVEYHRVEAEGSV